MSINDNFPTWKQDTKIHQGFITRLRFILRSYSLVPLEDLCTRLLNTAIEVIGFFFVVGPIRLPTKIQKWCVLSSPHVNKTSRDQFEIRTHKRIIDIIHPTLHFYKAVVNVSTNPGIDIKVVRIN